MGILFAGDLRFLVRYCEEHVPWVIPTSDLDPPLHP